MSTSHKAPLTKPFVLVPLTQEDQKDLFLYIKSILGITINLLYNGSLNHAQEDKWKVGKKF